MKKLLIMTLIGGMILSTGVTAFAREKVKEPGKAKEAVVQERFRNYFDKLEQRTENFKQKKEVRIESGEMIKAKLKKRFLTVVEEWNPDLYDDYEDADKEHIQVHRELFKSRTDDAYEFRKDTLKMAKEMETKLFQAVKDDEISLKEAVQQLRSFMQERREIFKSRIEEYRAAVDEIRPGNKEEIQALRQELRSVIEEENKERAEEILEELLAYLIEHIEFDQEKLQLMEEIFQF